MQVLLAHLVDTFNNQFLTALPPTATQQRRPPGSRQQARIGIAAGLAGSRAMPLSGDKQEWLAFIAALPDMDQPHVFGLPANIERAQLLGTSRQLLAALRKLGSVQVGGACAEPSTVSQS